MFCVAFALGCRWSNKIARLRLILAANVVLIWDDIEEKPNVATKPFIFSVKTQRFNFQKQNRENQTTQKIQSNNGSQIPFRGKVSELQEIRSNEDQDSQECQDELLHLLLLLFALLYPRQHCDGSSFMSSLQSFDQF